MIIVKEKMGKAPVQEGMTNYDKAVVQTATSKTFTSLQDQYKSNVKTAGSYFDASRFAYAQVYGTLSGIIGNLSMINSDTPRKNIETLMGSIQKIMDEARKGLNSFAGSF